MSKGAVIDSHDYHVRLEAAGPLTGTLTAPSDELPDLVVSSPPEFGGPGGDWSPEHLFVASVSACLMTTFKAVAARSGVDVEDYRDSASGHLVRGEDGLYRIDEVTLRPVVTVSPDARKARVERLLDKAEKVCLISRSMGCDVKMEPEVRIARLVG